MARVRLFLDAHVSGRKVAVALRATGYDVRAADEDRSLDGLNDRDLLALATAEDRLLVTFNARDFAVITREWAEAGRLHAGCAIVVGVDHGEFGAIVRMLLEALAARVHAEEWRNLTMFLSRRPSP